MARREQVKATCPTCGKVFELPPSRLRDSGNYCSPECAYEARRLHLGEPPLCACGCRQPVTGKRRGQWCDYLHGHNFQGQSHSDETREKMREAKLAIVDEIVKRVTGPGNPMWRNGHAQVYDAERLASGFNSYQRRKTRKRLMQERGHKCERCGATTKPLSLHHIDHDLFHNDDDNLLLVCHSCQMKFTAEFVKTEQTIQPY